MLAVVSAWGIVCIRNGQRRKRQILILNYCRIEGQGDTLQRFEFPFK